MIGYLGHANSGSLEQGPLVNREAAVVGVDDNGDTGQFGGWISVNQSA